MKPVFFFFLADFPQFLEALRGFWGAGRILSENTKTGPICFPFEMDGQYSFCQPWTLERSGHLRSEIAAP